MPVRMRSRMPNAASRSPFRWPTASRSSIPVRTARRASSSRSSSMPNIATTASPMNFSTLPPCRSAIARAAEKYLDRTADNASGSRRSAMVVDSTRSVNSTVIVLRRSPLFAVRVTGDPHWAQNRAPSMTPAPHVGQLKGDISRRSAIRRAARRRRARTGTPGRTPHRAEASRRRSASSASPRGRRPAAPGPTRTARGTTPSLAVAFAPCWALFCMACCRSPIVVVRHAWNGSASIEASRSANASFIPGLDDDGTQVTHSGMGLGRQRPRMTSIAAPARCSSNGRPSSSERATSLPHPGSPRMHSARPISFGFASLPPSGVCLRASIARTSRRRNVTASWTSSRGRPFAASARPRRSRSARTAPPPGR